MPAAALLPEGGSKEEEEEGERSLWVAFHVPWPPREVAEPCPGAPLLAACPGCAVAVLGLLEEEAAGGSSLGSARSCCGARHGVRPGWVVLPWDPPEGRGQRAPEPSVAPFPVLHGPGLPGAG